MGGILFCHLCCTGLCKWLHLSSGFPAALMQTQEIPHSDFACCCIYSPWYSSELFRLLTSATKLSWKRHDLNVAAGVLPTTQENRGVFVQYLMYVLRWQFEGLQKDPLEHLLFPAQQVPEILLLCIHSCGCGRHTCTKASFKI